jgi:SPP1 family predicted phage head-tail adaptor
MAIDSLYNQSFTVYNPTFSNDHGSMTRTLGDGSTVSGRIRKLNGNEVFEYGQEKEKSTHMFYCAKSNTITSISIVKYGDNYYKVVDVNNPHEMDRFYQVTLVYLPEGADAG